MKICKRALNFMQIMDVGGNVRICSWANNNVIGNLFEDDLYTIYHGEKADAFRQRLLEGDFSDCPKDNCPYLANGTIADALVDIDAVPEYPDSLYLDYEGNCNYRCTCCTSHLNMEKKESIDYNSKYNEIERKINEILPNITTIGAHGRGELFASRHILDILHNWKPKAASDKINVRLETNGSLFDKEHWSYIENLGQYHLRVAITVMSFDEKTYQFLSGCSYPISRIINNLNFVKGLREKNVINELEIATVMQEYNFREMPEFAKRCIEEFGADVVRIRPIMPGGSFDEGIQWFMDVRNPLHPYYTEYKAVMENEIFKNPKVLLWSNKEDSTSGEHPWKRKAELLEKERKVSDVLYKMILQEKLAEKVSGYLQAEEINNIAVYGMGAVGKSFLKLVGKDKIPLKYVFDNDLSGTCWNGYEIEALDKSKLDKVEAVLITSILKTEEMQKSICDYKGRVLYMQDIIG